MAITIGSIGRILPLLGTVMLGAVLLSAYRVPAHASGLARCLESLLPS